MAFRDMAGLGQYGNVRKPEPPPGPRKTTGMINIPTQKPRKGFNEEDDSETSFYFSQSSSMYRPDKEMMSSQSPSQISGFGNQFYNQALPMPRMGANQFPRSTTGHITPTSMNHNFNLSFQQPQQTPNTMGAIGPRTVLGQTPKRPAIPQVYGGATGQITNMSGTFGFPPRGGDSSNPSLDLSEFPSLVNRSSAPPNPITAGRNYVGMVSKQVSEQTPEFNITQEEFPALPGVQNPPVSTSDPSRKNDFQGVFQPSSISSGSYDQMNGKDKGEKTAAPKRGIQTLPDGTVSNIPGTMVTDQFGIVGLLTFIRAAENDPNLVALAPGIDLTTLGLNLNSPENLYSTFQSPWADAPCRPQDIDFHVPQEYLTNIYIRDKLAPIKLNRYGEDLLFFLFYMNGGDVLQLAAAAELYTRDWRYHKEERVWMTRAPGMEPVVKNNTYERGTYYFFDPTHWRKVAKEFHLEYEKLEDRPSLPSTFHHNNQSLATH